MNDEPTPEMRMLLEEITANLTILQAQVHALIAVSPMRDAIISSFEERMELHTAQILGNGVPDTLLELIEALRQTALKEMRE